VRQLALPVRLRASSLFESFYAGANAATVTQLISLAPGAKPPVVWLYGPAGVGKTHLLQALCARAGQQDLAATYWPMRDVAALDADLLSGCESLAFTCLDDFAAIAGNATWERAVFRLYTELEDHGGRLVIAAEGPPASLRIGLADLSSRLAAGTVLRLQALTDEEQMAALSLRALQLGLELPQDTAQFILRRLPRDMALLCDVLDGLDQASLVTQRKLTVPFVRSVLEARDSKLGEEPSD
jgi:DnaA family protein